MPIYARSVLITNTASMISGTISATDANTCINRAVREVIADVDLRSTKRKSALAPNLFDDIWDHTCPTDLKGMGIVDIRPQIKRGRLDQWRLTTEEEFDRIKEDHRIDYWGDPIRINRSQWLGDSIVAISDADFVRKIKLARPVDDDKVTIDSLDAVGTWIGFGDGTNLTADSSNYAKGSAAINWDINATGGTTAGIVNSSIPTFDISSYLTEGSVFVWAYITSTTNITNFILRIGSSSSAYNYITVTTTNEGVTFQAGWNLLRFDFVNKSTTGSPTNTACTYVALYMTKAGAKISETDYRFDDITMRKGEHYDLIYYSKYGWQTAAGAYLENSTADTDLLNMDTEEIRLIEYKGAELMERNLKNPTEGDRYFSIYQTMIKEYQFKYPSESLILTTTYHFIDI
jgi:hypothetical protein